MQALLQFMRTYVACLASCAYLLTVGVFVQHHRAQIPRVLALRRRAAAGPAPPPPSPQVSKVDVDELAPQGVEIAVLDPGGRDGDISLLELIVMNRLLRCHRPKTCLEIGTFNGRTTLNMAANTPADGTVYTLDLPRHEMAHTGLELDLKERKYVDKHQSGEQFAGSEYAERIVQLFGDSASFDFGPYYGQVDFVFVDGSHSYAYVKNDTEVALRLLRNGKGVIVWHDYGIPCWPGVTQALNESYTGDKRLAGLRHIPDTSLVVLVTG